MVVKAGYCAGHGGSNSTAGKRDPDGIYEWNYNDKVARAFHDELSKYEGVELRRFDDASGKTDVPLSTRTKNANAWGADFYISFHHNANTGKWGEWTGSETHVYKTAPSGSVKLAKEVQAEMVKAYGLRDRGIKYTDLHITRETNCDAILTEGGYMDSTIDIKKLRDDKVLENAGRGIASAVARVYGLKKKVVVQPTPVAPKPVSPSVPVATNGVHVVKAGDTLWSIAKANGVTVDKLKELNKGIEATELKIGSQVKVKEVATAPVANAKLHTVAKGDTLYGIAKKYGVSVDNLKTWNKGVEATELKIGSQIAVSNGAIPVAQPTPQPVAPKPVAQQPAPKPTVVAHKHEFKKLGRAKGSVYSHTKPDFTQATRGVVVGTGESLKVCCDQNGLYYTDKGWVSVKYVDIVGDLKKVDLPSGVYRRGSRGTAVVQIQRALNQLAFKCGAEDGIFGSGTENALKRFQMVHDAYHVDGVYGSRVEAKMEALLNK